MVPFIPIIMTNGVIIMVTNGVSEPSPCPFLWLASGMQLLLPKSVVLLLCTTSSACHAAATPSIKKKRKVCLIVDGSLVLQENRQLQTELATVGLQASELSTCSAGQAHELTGCSLPSQTRSEVQAVSVLGKATALARTAAPAVSSSADSADRLQHIKFSPVRNSRISEDLPTVDLMQPLQRSKSEPVYVGQRQDNTVLMRKAGSQGAQYPPMANFAGESMWSVHRGVPDASTGTVGVEGVQPELYPQHGHAFTDIKLADVGLIPDQHLRNDIDCKSSLNAEIRLVLMPLLQDLAFTVTAAKQLPIGHRNPAHLQEGSDHVMHARD